MLDRKTRILVVDDMPTSRKIVKKYLSEIGYNLVDEATDGEMAWTKILGSNPQYGLIIADWHMPNISGLDLLKKVRAKDEYKNLPFILVTGERKQNEIKEAINCGVTNYVVKPFQAETLFKAVEKIKPPVDEVHKMDEELKKMDETREELKLSGKSK
ncbi:MAG: response regulator [Oligoflexia bacterium]|nr:response regulator [Oligoflexia bacterium]